MGVMKLTLKHFCDSTCLNLLKILAVHSKIKDMSCSE